MEKAYRTMKNSGAGSIVIGIIILVTGVAAVSYTHLRSH